MSTTERDLAAVLHGARDLRVEPGPVDTPGAGQVLVDVGSVGLCGSDLHYYADGRNGPNVLRTPTVLGHEGHGVISAVGPDVDAARVGQRVAIEPARPCGRCTTCLSGRYNLCPSGICFGSPPTHGLLRGQVAVPAEFAHPLPNSLPDAVAALVEPLAVACWAVQRARVRPGHHVLVTGAGPIGLLAAQAARAAGAARVCVVDVSAPRRAVAERALIGTGIEVAAGPGNGPFDRQLECSGAPAAIADLSALAPGAVLALVGTPPAEAAAPLGHLQRWEVDVVGCFRYGPGAFAAAIALAAAGRVALEPLVTARFPLAEAARAIETALTDRTQLKIVVDLPTRSIS